MRLLKFSSIKKFYKEYYNRFYVQGKVPVKDTKLGMWGVSSADDVFEIFKKLNVHGKFLDLGSGDGKVVLVASLFCDSVTGVECDDELIKLSKEFANQLGIKAEFLLDDYMNIDLCGYDYIFINPDHELDDLSEKLKDYKGMVVVYSNLYFLKLNKIKEFRVSDVKVTCYSNMSF
ncbi:class I SAM-dependent methyltransferase [Candidatus Woesearchaeota archaeon]|nr:class I SAM-dependent methyltransferase [Candidatus Woesearchaeota archaeon]MBW3021844.1 class I SAM-dependent methyltransferase [Candidatus Woesearchaeota archaeon]